MLFFSFSFFFQRWKNQIGCNVNIARLQVIADVSVHEVFCGSFATLLRYICANKLSYEGGEKIA